MNWDAANRRDAAKRPDPDKWRISKWADKILNAPAPQSKVVNNHGRKSYRARKHQQKPREVFITVGADCPWNTTPGVRQTYHFESVEAAHAAGFTAVR